LIRAEFDDGVGDDAPGRLPTDGASSCAAGQGRDAMKVGLVEIVIVLAIVLGLILLVRQFAKSRQ
jgi:hypothetical protein